MPDSFAGRYELHEQLSAGGTGSVWRAWDREGGRWVAVEVVSRSEAETLLRFVGEQSMRVRHPHVVAPDGWAAAGDRVAVSMDLVRGGSLETLLEGHGSLPETFVAVLLDQILEGLGAIHAAGVAHRDIKPANILLEPTGSGRPFVRVAGFGAATRVSVTDPAPALDLYAVGILGRRLLTGSGPGHLPGENPSQLWGFVQHLTDPDPRRRLRSAESARRLLAPYVPAGEPWAGADAPYVVERLEAPEPNPGRVEVVSAAMTDRTPAALASTAEAAPRLGREQLRAVTVASVALATVLLLIVLVLLLR